MLHSYCLPVIKNWRQRRPQNQARQYRDITTTILQIPLPQQNRVPCPTPGAYKPLCNPTPTTYISLIPIMWIQNETVTKTHGGYVLRRPILFSLARGVNGEISSCEESGIGSGTGEEREANPFGVHIVQMKHDCMILGIPGWLGRSKASSMQPRKAS